MSTRLRLALLAVALLAATATAPSAASAVTGFQVSPAGTYTATGTLSFSSSLGTATCDAILTATVASSWSATALATAGTLTGGRFTNCRGAVSAFALTGTSTAGYVSFAGTPSSPRSFTESFLGLTFTATTIFGACQYRGNQTATLDIVSGTTLTLGRSTLAKVGGAGACPASGTLSATFALSPRLAVTVLDTEPPTWQWTPASVVDFGVQAAGTTTTSTITFTNTTQLRTYTTIPPQGSVDDPVNFSFDAARLPNNLIILPGGSVSIDVSFTPPAGAPANTLEISGFGIHLRDDTGHVFTPSAILRGRTP
ncbi:hypothetical protein VSS74_13080 [Conexibacter stalactiti]|uniref:Choice-of-anchor D domain-containing protein n=1 Tax=Conexibacter stalactiti TaxID=1940611 RepID=A0ABU4HPR4_9ACTN|nr:hypothetical protein [Conexibacter stalactiti]MDW5595276.1 hypothetical protein [Conexibacter stalactiti]MEC5035918.1 hypothetical protein [Conexibacter stalactiti]